MFCLNLSNVTMITITCVVYLCIIPNISKSEAINLSKNYVLDDCRYIKKCISKNPISKVEPLTIILTIQRKQENSNKYISIIKPINKKNYKEKI